MKGRENIWSNLVISNSSCLLSVSVCSMLSSVHCCRFQSLLPKRTELWPSQLYWRNYKETPFNSWAGKREEEVLSDRWMRSCCYRNLTESFLTVLMVSISISRHKRNLGVRQLADYRPYWFARDLRGSKGTKVRARAGARAGASVDI